MSVRLLYVEDDDDLRRLLSMMLINEGYDVVAVSSAEDAIVELQTGRYPVLLTDYNLSNKNADWMLQVAANADALRDTAVVILTAEARPSGIDGYRVLRKPVDVSVLFAALDEAVATQVAGLAPRTEGNGADVKLTLYVTGSSRESKKAIRNLNRILKKYDATRIHLDVCDVSTSGLPADSLEADRIVVTPTLVRWHPLPKVWVFGDLSKIDAVDELITSGLARVDRAAAPPA